MKRAESRHVPLHVEALEERNLLTTLVVVPSPQFSGRLNATAAIADNDIWAVGVIAQTNPTLAEHFNGKTWSVVPTPSGIEGRFNGVSGVASNDVWAVGTMTGPDNPDFGEQFIEHWNGKSWSVVASPTIEGDALNSVVAVSANNVWAVGALAPEGANALVEHWDGTSWSIVSNSVIAGAGRLSSVSADAANDVWAVGQAGNGGAPLLHFNGTTWSQLPGPPGGMQANAVLALSPTDVWAVGKKQYEANHRVHFRASIEQWNGTSWSLVASPTTSDTSLNGIAAISANDILAVGGGTATSLAEGTSATLAEEWNGTSWSIISSPNPGTASNGLSAVTALSDGTVAAVGFQINKMSDAMPLILQNTASAPPGGGAAALVTTTAAPSGTMAAMPISISTATSRAGTAGQSRTLPAPLDTAPVDRFFAQAGQPDPLLSVAGTRSGAPKATTAASWMP
jgi:hypothetical protein